MPKKYRFNPDSLSYDRLDNSFKARALNTLTYLAALTVVAVLVNILFSVFFDTPKEKGLKRENEFLETQYEVINNQLGLIENTLQDLQRRDSNIYRVIFEAEPIPYAVRMAGYGGSDKYKKLEGYSSSDLIKETTKKLDQLSRRIYVQSR